MPQGWRRGRAARPAQSDIPSCDRTNIPRVRPALARSALYSPAASIAPSLRAASSASARRYSTGMTLRNLGR